jgi:hypothetical protein
MLRMIEKNNKFIEFNFLNYDSKKAYFECCFEKNDFIDFSNNDTFLKNISKKEGFDVCFVVNLNDCEYRKYVLCYDIKTKLYFVLRIKKDGNYFDVRISDFGYEKENLEYTYSDFLTLPMIVKGK